MTDREKRYNRDFLNWNEEKFNLLSKLYYPKIHIHPWRGLINDPNCVFYYNKKYYIFFQHHPNNPIHGLKTMSLAITKDFKQFEYRFMVNKPEDDFSYHGIYSGNALISNNKIICMYTGNKRDKDWNRTSSIVISEFDINLKKFQKKKILITNFTYNNYTEHFRDPFIFKYKENFYFLIGAQTKKEQGVILLFRLDENLTKAKLIKEIFISSKYRMIECPNFLYIKNKIALIYSPQFKTSSIPSSQNPDIVRYLITEPKELFNEDFYINFENKKEQIIDYGFEYYAPQVFLKNKKYEMIAWAGIPTSNDYPESKKGWIFCLTSVRCLELKKDKLLFKLPYKIKQNFNSKNNLVERKKVRIKLNERIIIGDKKSNIVINFFNQKTIIVSRIDNNKYYPYDNQVLIDLDNNFKKVNIEIFFDNSIIEILINNSKWFTSRIYPDELKIARE